MEKIWAEIGLNRDIWMIRDEFLVFRRSQVLRYNVIYMGHFFYTDPPSGQCQQVFPNLIDIGQDGWEDRIFLTLPRPAVSGDIKEKRHGLVSRNRP